MGMLLRFRQLTRSDSWDKSKMFHAIGRSLQDGMIHSFLWRDLNRKIQQQIYVMARVDTGDRPLTDIAHIVLRKSAIEAEKEFPLESSIIQKIFT